MNARNFKVHFMVSLLVVSAPAADAIAQTFRCSGNVAGIPSQSSLEVTPGGLWKEGPSVAGRIQNQRAEYLFNGILFGGSEGFVDAVELRTGARFERVWIGLSQAGYTLRTEDGWVSQFQCQP